MRLARLPATWLTQLGYPFSALRQAGLVTAAGYDAYHSPDRFSAENATSMAAASRLRRRLIAFLPGTKGGLYDMGAGPANAAK